MQTSDSYSKPTTHSGVEAKQGIPTGAISTGSGTPLQVYQWSGQEKDPNGLVPNDPGAKLDAGKVDMSLLTLWPRALTEVARVGTLGATKYSRGGFLSVPNGVVRYTAAMLRHLFKESTATYDDDPYYDTPEGVVWKGTIRHDAQVAWNALSRLEIRLREEEEGK